MEKVLALNSTNERIKTIAIDILALVVVFATPSLAHMFNIPFYLAEPIRIMLVLSLLHTRKENAYALAIALPLFSFLVSGHPVFFKALIIVGELTLNVWLFLFLLKYIKNSFGTMLISVVGSKLFYYLLQFGFVSIALLTAEQVEHPIIPQMIMCVILSAYAFLVFKQKEI